MSRRSLWSSLANALRGLAAAVRRERNIRIQLVVAVLITLAGLLFHITRIEWLFLIASMVAVLVLELVNSAVEAFADLVRPRLHDQVGHVKDIMAGAVLVAALGSVAVGVTIFLPYIVEILL